MRWRVRREGGKGRICERVWQERGRGLIPYDCKLNKNAISQEVWCSPNTVRYVSMVAEPRLLRAQHVYTPSSSRVTLVMVSDVTPPVVCMVTRSDSMAASSCSHDAVGSGEPETWYWNETEVPTGARMWAGPSQS